MSGDCAASTRTPEDFSYPRKWKRNELSGLMRTRHEKKSIERFKATKVGETEEVGRNYRLDPYGLCSTLRAGTGYERGSFVAVRPIHPSQPRVIAVREAARQAEAGRAARRSSAFEARDLRRCGTLRRRSQGRPDSRAAASETQGKVGESAGASGRRGSTTPRGLASRHSNALLPVVWAFRRKRSACGATSGLTPRLHVGPDATRHSWRKTGTGETHSPLKPQ